MRHCYDTYLARKENIHFTTEECGHYVWDNAASWRESLQKFRLDLWDNLYKPQELLNVSKQFIQSVSCLVLGVQSFRTRIRPEADSFSMACVVLSGNKYFKPILRYPNGVFYAGKRTEIKKLAAHLKGNIKKGVAHTEILETSEKEAARIARIVDLISGCRLTV